MANNRKQVEFARKLLQLSLDNGEVKEDRVAAILKSLEKNPPSKLPTVLRIFLSLVKKEIKKYSAHLEYAGSVSDASIKVLESNLSEIYGRKIYVTATENKDLIAGVRVSVADDVYENSVISRMRPLRKISL
jgi:F-type H+-transporting ATPase subunit delta